MNNNNNADSDYNKKIEDKPMTIFSDASPTSSSLNDSHEEDRNNLENDQSHIEREENVINKPSLQINNNFDSDTVYNTADTIEDLVRQWEADNNQELAILFRQIATQAAICHIEKKRGLTILDLEEHLGWRKNYADRLVRQAVDMGVLIRMDIYGHPYEYVLSNYVHILESTRFGYEDEYIIEDIIPSDVLLALAKEISKIRYQYHNLHLVTTLNYKEDYELLNWPVSTKESNQQKVKSFKLKPRRILNLVISKGGIVNIYINCTDHPFEFHSAEGLMDFIGTLGQIYLCLQSSVNRENVTPWFGKWFVMQFKYNKDLQNKNLSSQAIEWFSKGVFKTEYCGVIFKIYCKMVPYKGECLRAEGQYETTKDKAKTVDDIIPYLTSSDSDEVNDGNYNKIEIKKEEKHPFTTIEEMLLSKGLEKQNEVSEDKQEEGE